MAQRAFDLSIEYSVTRKRFEKPIGSFQLVQGMLTDMYTDVESLRALTYQLGREIKDLPACEGQGTIH
jgi:isovaleryl-CoA dehydrogenase